MKPIVIVSSIVFMVLAAIMAFQTTPAAIAEETPLHHFRQLRSPKHSVVTQSIEHIEKNWHPGAAVMLLESTRFASSRGNQLQILALLSRKTNQRFAFDHATWYRWLWSQEYTPHPDYAEFKGELYSRVDKRFPEYFKDAEYAKIRLDEIRWGGVKRDGIPPLKNPKMITTDAATYLEDSNEVFGIALNGEARCYPKRILAWHEMFKDTIGGKSYCGVY